MITTPIFTRLLTTSEFGQYNVFNSWYGIIAIIVSLNLSGGVHQQALVKFDKEKAILSSSLQGITTLFVIAWSIIYFIFIDFWNELFSLSTVQMTALLIMIQTSAAFHFWTNEQRVEYKYKMLVIITLLVSLAKPIVGIFLVTHYEDRVTARILGLALVELIGYSGLYFAQMKRGKKFFSEKFWKYAVLYNLPLVPHYLSQTVLNSADRIMIEKIVGDSEAGIYSLAYSISSIMVLFNSALSQTIGPWLYQKIKVHKTQDMEKVGYSTIIIIASVNLLLMILAPEAIAIFAPQSYSAALWTIPPVAMGAVFLYSYDLFAKFAFYYEKTFFVMIVSVFGAIMNIILNYIFISMFGYIAAGYTTLICYIIYAVGHYMYMLFICKKYNDKTYPYKTKILIGIFGAFMASGFLIMLTYDYPVIRYGIVVIVFVTAFIYRNKIVRILKELFDLRQKKNI